MMKRLRVVLASRQPIDFKRIFYARVPFALFMLYMGLGRFDVFAHTSQSDILPDRVYGGLLLFLALAILLTHPWRFGWLARLFDGLAALLMATMAWDVGYIGTTALFEITMALSFVSHFLFNHDH
jgi:hypothetical protein